MKVAVYTAITAERDALKEPRDASGADLVVFSDCPRAESGWEVRRACEIFSDPRRNARAHKILAHQYLPDYEYSLWIDGSIRLLAPVLDLIDRYLERCDIAIFPHAVRDCVYREAEICTELGLDDPAVILAQMTRYQQHGHPTGDGLNESGVILRRHSVCVERFNNDWWSELCRYSCRDQLSLNYVLRKHGISPELFPGTIYDNPELFLYEGHADQLDQKSSGTSPSP